MRTISWARAIRNPQARTLYALARIPRCSRCPRLERLIEESRTGSCRVPPAIPAECRHAICAPLFEQPERGDRTGNQPLRWVQPA